MWYLVFVGALVAYALVAVRLERWNVTGPMVFLTFGMALGISGVAGSMWLGGEEFFLGLMTLTLALLLFADASTIGLRDLRHHAATPLRLLFIGLPLTVLAGLLGARLLLPLSTVGMAALIAVILAPTDVSLGLTMFGNERVPAGVRRSINVESGLNDGLAAPLVALAIAGVIAESEHASAPIIEAAAQIGLGVIAGAALGVVGGMLVSRSQTAEWSTRASRNFGVFALAGLAYMCSVAIGGNGFVAAFIGGLAFGAVTPREMEGSTEFSEEVGTLLSLGVWFVFGTLAGVRLAEAGLQWQPIVYAALSLTLFRMAPVALSLWETGLKASTGVFMGWFGPRGLASVIFLLDALIELERAGVEVETLLITVAWTVVLSVILHGLSAGPVADWYAEKSGGFAPDSPELEGSEVSAARMGITRPSSWRRR